MKLGVAQTRPVKGDIQRNIETHIRLLHLATAEGTDFIVFPELSITGYEPSLAATLATTPDDNRLAIFQQISDLHQISIGIGAPIRLEQGVAIGLVLFQPNRPRQLYTKQYLHSDELPFFSSSNHKPTFTGVLARIALAICYELSVPEHASDAHQRGADMYITSVAKSVNGVEKAVSSLADIAKKYTMSVLMANCIGYCDNFDCGGHTAAWDKNGNLLGCLNDVEEGILLLDTKTQDVIVRTL